MCIKILTIKIISLLAQSVFYIALISIHTCIFGWRVWECDCGYFLKFFSLVNVLK
jgi:hypothetical protein